VNISSLAKLLAAGAVALALFVGRHRIRNVFALPGILLMSIVIVHLALVATGISLGEAQSSGWVFEPPSSHALARHWNFDELRRFPWSQLPALSGDLLAVIFVTAISLLLNITGIELDYGD
jgi:sulfate permease, SulP family